MSGYPYQPDLDRHLERSVQFGTDVIHGDMSGYAYSGIDVSQGEMAGYPYQPDLDRHLERSLQLVHRGASRGKKGSERHQVKKELASGSRGIDVSQGNIAGPTADGDWTRVIQRCFLNKYGFDFYAKDGMCGKKFGARQAKRLEFFEPGMSIGPAGPTLDEDPEGCIQFCNHYMDLKYAELALEFYEKSQGAKFEVVEALYSKDTWLVVPGTNSDCSRLVRPDPDSVQEWCHVSFIAKSKNADCSGDVFPKHFFAEFQKDRRSGLFNAKYCSTFEPTDDPGFNHGCVFCPADQKFHPGAHRYRIGRPPCYVLKGDLV